MVTFHIYRYIRLSYLNSSQLAELLSKPIPCHWSDPFAPLLRHLKPLSSSFLHLVIRFNSCLISIPFIPYLDINFLFNSGEELISLKRWVRAISNLDFALAYSFAHRFHTEELDGLRSSHSKQTQPLIFPLCYPKGGSGHERRNQLTMTS